MARVILEIPEDIQAALRLPPGEIEPELRRELALALYARGILSLGKARALARMDRWAYEELLGQRKIPRHYTEEDVLDDIRYARSG